MTTESLDILILAPGMPFVGDTLEHKSLGGSETAALCMARELVKLGHRSTVFTNGGPPGVYDGVNYMPIAEWGRYSQMVPHDVTIIQRAPEAMTAAFYSRLSLLWCHDLALMRQGQAFNGIMWNVDKVLVVSRYMGDQYKQVYNLPEDALWVTRNGIELDRFEKVKALFPDGLPRDRKKLIFAARPERGLDVLLTRTFPALLKRDPELRLHLCGYDNTVQQMQEFYAYIDTLIGSLGDRVVWLGHLTKEQLYYHYLTAGVYVYPTPSPTSPLFSEVSCISAMEAQAAGLPFVTTERGALPETLAPKAGRLISGDPQSPEYQESFVEAVLRYVQDDAAWQEASTAGLERAKQLDWSGIAQEWVDGFWRLIEERNDNKYRLALHFIRRSDIIAAKALLPELQGVQAEDVKTRLDAMWSFTDKGQDGYREQYERIGQTHAPSFEAEGSEVRFHAVREWMKARPDLQRILDFGCAHGAYTVNLSNALPERTFVGVDIDKHGIMWAERFRSQKASTPGNLSFRVGNETVDLSDQEPFDLLWMGEVLEHVPEPWAVVDALERWLKPGAQVLLTVPYGPWEYMSYQTYPHRAHVWEYDLHDLRDLFKNKAEFQINTMPWGPNELTGEICGWHLVTFKVNGQPCGQIDMDRKARLQRPKQSVSASLVCGPNAEDNLHWCLKSIKYLADEIVMADTGMSEEGRRIARQYGVRLIPGRNPTTEGFESPRNDTLPHCRMDWVLWIDSDEQLVEPQNVTKYLRENLFNGYSIRQHHFACDTSFKPDLPVRLFRNRPIDGKSMRWYGMIHEHPELALNHGPGTTIILADAHIAHVGYLVESRRRKRFARNLPMLEKDIATYPERMLQQHFIMRDSILLATYELQQNGGKITDAIKERCKRTIDTWQKHFKGRPGYMNTDSLEYYSTANKILNQGFDFSFSFAAGKDGAPLNGSHSYRFASMEDLEAEMGWRIKDTAHIYANEWW